MTWRKISERSWVAAFGQNIYWVLSGYENGQFYSKRVRPNEIRQIGKHDALRKAKLRCEADRILG